MNAQFSSVAQLWPTLCNPMDCSTPGFPVRHQLPELAQTHVHEGPSLCGDVSGSVSGSSTEQPHLIHSLHSTPMPRATSEQSVYQAAQAALRKYHTVWVV